VFDEAATLRLSNPFNITTVVAGFVMRVIYLGAQVRQMGGGGDTRGYRGDAERGYEGERGSARGYSTLPPSISAGIHTNSRTI
jgi:hypothetical protein